MLLILWGLAFGGMPVSIQTWILKAAPQTTEAATALNTSMLNFAIALGAFMSGTIVSIVRVDGLLWVAVAIVALALLFVARILKASSSRTKYNATIHGDSQ